MDRPQADSQIVQKAIRRLVIGVALFAVGCSTYQTKVSEARNLLESGRAKEAALHLEKYANEEGDDQLIYKLDYATALQAAGQYKESVKAFVEADQIAELKDYHSISRISGSLLLNEGMVQYKGEDFEKLLLNTMNAINFVLMGNLELALVETRRLNEKIQYFRTEEKKEYKHNTFAKYLSAMLWEADGNFDNAFTEYENAYQIDPTIPYLKEDLVRLAKVSDRPEKLQKYSKKFGIQYQPKWNDKKTGELILIYQQGWGPRKAPRPESHRFPMLRPAFSETKRAEMEVVDGPRTQTQTVYSVQENAIRTMDEEYGALVARRMGGVVAKEVAAKQISDKNAALGAVAWIAMHASDQADLRQWSTLPETFQVARLRLLEGTYRIKVHGQSESGLPTGESKEFQDVVIKGRKMTFIGWRSFK